MKIVQLESENVKRIRAVHIVPHGNVVEITGPNAAGKSSVIDSIAYALGGAGLCPQAPIRQGESRAEVTVTLDEMTVTRVWTLKDSYLRVQAADGSDVRSPQAALDKLVGKLGFDPLEFARMRPADQRDALLKLVGLGPKLAELDDRRQRVAEYRRNVGRDLRAQQARLTSMPAVPDGTPNAPIVMADLLNEMAEAERQNSHIAELLDVAREVSEHVRVAREAVAKQEEEIERLKKALADAEGKRVASIEAVQHAEGALLKANMEAGNAVAVDIAPIRERILNAEQINAAVRLRSERAAVEQEIINLSRQVDAFDENIQKVDAEKHGLLRGAQWPLDGLGFSEGGVTYRGVPFEQCSSAEQLRVSVGIAMSMNPTLRVLMVRDGSLLDGENLKAMYEMVTAADYQLWIERVAGDGGTGFVIEDGALAAEPAAGACAAQ